MEKLLGLDACHRATPQFTPASNVGEVSMPLNSILVEKTGSYY